jgi:hypothetical protein
LLPPDFLRAELDRIGPAQEDLCRDFFQRAAALVIALKPAVGCVSGSAVRLSSVTPSASRRSRETPDCRAA